MNVLDLFSGIGGFSLGLERAGMRTVAFCEIEPYCRAVLRKHWPGVPVFGDVRLLTRGMLLPQGIEPEVICGGFPCQDISLAGKGAGLGGERSGLWSEFHRLIDELRPRYAIIENVSALRSRGLDSVLGSLAAIGYDAEWHCIPACAVGAPHRRDRIWIVAYPHGERQQERQERHGGPIGPGLEAPCRDDAVRLREAVADADEHLGDERRPCNAAQEQGRRQSDRGGVGAHDLAHADDSRLQGRLRAILQERAGERPAGTGCSSGIDGYWLAEPDVGRVANGVRNRVDRLRALGNAVVPQIPEIIGRAIMRGNQ